LAGRGEDRFHPGRVGGDGHPRLSAPRSRLDARGGGRGGGVSSVSHRLRPPSLTGNRWRPWMCRRSRGRTRSPWQPDSRTAGLDVQPRALWVIPGTYTHPEGQHARTGIQGPQRRSWGGMRGHGGGLHRDHDPAGEPCRNACPWRALKKWIPVENPADDPDWFDQSNPWRPREIHQDDRIFVLDAD